MQAARTSILRDSLATASVTGRGYEANETGAVPGLLGQLASVQQGQLDTSLGGLAGRGLFAPPLYSVETTLPFPQDLTSVPLVWRSDVCAHLRIDGACPAARGQVIVSRDSAAAVGWHIGQQLRFPGYSALTITGLYRMPDQSLDYWFGRGTHVFPGCADVCPGFVGDRRDVRHAVHAGAEPSRPGRARRSWTRCSIQGGSPAMR